MPIERPERCLRGLGDCSPLAQLASDCGSSFICVGENDGTSRVHAQDLYRKCDVAEGAESMADCDQRDLTDELSVIAQALSLIENAKANE